MSSPSIGVTKRIKSDENRERERESNREEKTPAANNYICLMSRSEKIHILAFPVSRIDSSATNY